MTSLCCDLRELNLENAAGYPTFQNWRAARHTNPALTSRAEDEVECEDNVALSDHFGMRSVVAVP
jgi:hypothetical protein